MWRLISQETNRSRKIVAYDEEHKLKITRIYNMIPSLMDNKKKCVVYHDIDAVMNDRLSVNLGSVYESVVASELRAHCSGPLYYYDNKAHGEVEFLLDDYDHAAIRML
jgi:predicted AAA+ superfamily ATPase